MKKLDLYIIKKYLSTFLFTLCLFVLISVVIDISEKIDDFLEKDAPLWIIIKDYYFNFIPYFLNLFSPVFIFIAVIFFTAKMAGNTEIVAILGSGLSFTRFLRPYFIAAGIVVGISLLLNAWIIPICDQQRQAFEEIYVRDPRTRTTMSKNVHSQISPGVFVFMETFNYMDSIGYNFSIEKFEGLELKYKLISNRLFWNSDKQHWVMENYYIRTRNAGKEEIIQGYQKDTILPVKPGEFVLKEIEYSSLNTPDLNKFIKEQKSKGDPNIDVYLVENYRRVAAPFAYFVLTLLAASLSSRKVRGGVGVHLGMGIFISLSYLLVTQFAYTFGMSGQINPLIAVWMPNVLYLFLGLYLAYKAPK